MIVLAVNHFASHQAVPAPDLSLIHISNFANIPILAGYTIENLPYVLYVSAGVAGIGFCSYFLAMEYLSLIHILM